MECADVQLCLIPLGPCHHVPQTFMPSKLHNQHIFACEHRTWSQSQCPDDISWDHPHGATHAPGRHPTQVWTNDCARHRLVHDKATPCLQAPLANALMQDLPGMFANRPQTSPCNTDKVQETELLCNKNKQHWYSVHSTVNYGTHLCCPGPTTPEWPLATRLPGSPVHHYHHMPCISKYSIHEKLQLRGV